MAGKDFEAIIRTKPWEIKIPENKSVQFLGAAPASDFGSQEPKSGYFSATPGDYNRRKRFAPDVMAIGTGGGIAPPKITTPKARALELAFLGNGFKNFTASDTEPGKADTAKKIQQQADDYEAKAIDAYLAGDDRLGDQYAAEWEKLRLELNDLGADISSGDFGAGLKTSSGDFSLAPDVSDLPGWDDELGQLAALSVGNTAPQDRTKLSAARQSMDTGRKIELYKYYGDKATEAYLSGNAAEGLEFYEEWKKAQKELQGLGVDTTKYADWWLGNKYGGGGI